VIPQDERNNKPVSGSTDAGASTAVELIEVHVGDEVDVVGVEIYVVVHLSLQTASVEDESLLINESDFTEVILDFVGVGLLSFGASVIETFEDNEGTSPTEIEAQTGRQCWQLESFPSKSGSWERSTPTHTGILYAGQRLAR